MYLWIPTEHLLNLYRLILIGLLTAPSIRQYYYYVTQKNVTRIGSYLFVIILIILFECLSIYKLQPNNIPKMPFNTKIGIFIATTLYF